ncbi:U3 snoRNP protein [Lecanora helva]
MASASDKARFYLEQSVPELQDLSRKKIFTKTEITSIAKRRSDFEHTLNARGAATPTDYARYAEYEMNLESLRRKRATRLGVKSKDHVTGPRRIFFILDRSTRKFPGDLGLWMQYLAFARKQGSGKKVGQILTSALRLHPTKAEMWIYAAKYAMEDRGDIMEARGYMQRGLRFCQKEERLWGEYFRLECIWIAKVWARRRILGVDEDRERAEDGVEGSVGGIDGDVVALPKITAEDINPEGRDDDGKNRETLGHLEATPALSGAIPIAIFEAAMEEFGTDEKLCLRFFDIVTDFQDVPVMKRILNRIMETLKRFESPEALIHFIRQPVLGLRSISPGFPGSFQHSLDRINKAWEKLDPEVTANATARARSILDGYIIDWLLPYLTEEELDLDVRDVVMMTVKKAWSQFRVDTVRDPDGRAVDASRLITKMSVHRSLFRITDPAIIWAMQLWPKQTQLFSPSAQDQDQ